MVKVILLPHGGEPPLHEKYALVEIVSSSTEDLSDDDRHDGNGTFRVKNAGPDIASAIEDAREWAEKNDASVVYLIQPKPEPGAKL